MTMNKKEFYPPPSLAAAAAPLIFSLSATLILWMLARESGIHIYRIFFMTTQEVCFALVELMFAVCKFSSVAYHFRCSQLRVCNFSIASLLL